MTKEDRIKIMRLEKDLNEIKRKYQDNRPVTERINSLEEALSSVGFSEMVKAILDYSGADEHMISIRNFTRLMLTCEAFNEGWEPSLSASSTPKYYPWMKYEKGVGLSFSDCGSVYAHSAVGSRLLLKSPELVKHIALNLPQVFKDYFTF